jgi:GNAT superfamily N-acetyltransferase
MDANGESSEQVERAALTELHSAASDDLRRQLGLQLETVDSALVSIASGDPGVVVNRAIGLGVSAPATREGVQSIVASYAAADVGRYYVHVAADARPAELRGWLTDAGLERGRGWARFVRGVGSLPEARTDLDVRRISSEHAEDWARIVAGGFGLADASVPWLAGLADSPHWRLYVGFDGGRPAGAAGMFVRHDVAWFDWAATLPEFRRRGCQGALLHRRVHDALEAGCTRMLTETGEAVDGDPQHSYRNILRAGFELHDVRENYVPRPDTTQPDPG